MSITITYAVDEILHFLEDIPLSDNTVKYYGFCYQEVLRYCSENSLISFSHSDANSFCTAQEKRVQMGEICNTYALIMRKAAFALADYFSSGTICWKRQTYNDRVLPESYEVILENYETFLSDTLAPGSIRLIIQMLRKFLSFLVESGCTDISALDISHVRGFISRESSKHISHKINLTWPVKKFLHYLRDNALTDINADIFLTNPVPARKKVLPCLEDSEIQAIFDKVDLNSPRGKRDYAIMRLALDTGLRWSDIASLKLSEIDWRKKEISVQQEKTGTALKLPLTVEAGNAVAEYILNARPKTEVPYVFLRLRRPFDRLNSRTPAANIMLLYQSEGFRHESGDGKSFHAFRRTMGTRLIRADIPLTTVSQILGHTNLDSTKRYLYLHDEKLLACCMDLSKYPCRKEGLV